jgi:hypothetical protein
MATFVEVAVVPIVGPRDVLAPADLAAITDRLAPYNAWRADEVKTKVDAFDPGWLEQLAAPDLRARLAALIAQDAALAGEYDQITSVAKAVRLQRDGGRILRNFVNFSDFYGRQDGVFQAGTLYLDARAIHLCVNVNDVAKHAALASSSDSFLVYLDITRRGETRHIAAALTNGEADNIFIGRNGVFYDRDGEAFWTPYKKLVKMIEDNITRRAAAADATSHARLEAVGKTVATADKAALAPEPPPAPPPPAKKIDLGTIAAIGIAIGGIGTLFGALLSTMFGLGKWLPLGVVALLLMISGPSMLLAWLKLRRRNLGPILDANGWAINGRARINVAFGAAMTELPRLPKGSSRSFDDPFADKQTPWRLWLFLIVLLVVAGSWYVGKLDKYLPERVRSTSVLGADAPAAKKALAEAPVAPVAPVAPANPAPGTPAPAPAP